jgi:DNA-binding IscR family transcriptional regulator
VARLPGDISVGEVVQSLEGTLTCVDGILDMPCSISVGPSHCAIKEFLLDVKSQMEALLFGTSLADLANRQLYLSERAVLVQPRFLKHPSDKSRAREYTESEQDLQTQ